MSTLDSLRGAPYSAASGCAEMVGRQSIHTQGEVMLLAEMYDVQPSDLFPAQLLSHFQR